MEITEKPIVLELKNITKSFANTEVLRDISLAVHEGEFVTLLGSSGCGKTTILRIIAGLEYPDGGKVLLEGKNMENTGPEKRNVNMVFQNYALFPHMNVAQNIGYGLKIRGAGKEEIKKRVKEMLSLVQLDGYESRRPAAMSGGQRQRVAIARALINNPKVLLLDEPLGALDLQLRRQMQLELKRLQKKLGITFIYITHDQEEAINMSDRIAVMRGGRFEQIGTPEEIYDRPKTRYVAQFIGRSTILTGKVKSASGGSAVIENENGVFTVGAEPANVAAGENCDVCVRTERMRASLAPVDGFDLPATVREARYVGGSVLTHALMKDGTEVVCTGIERMADAPEAGAKVYLHWDPAQAAVIGGASYGA